MLWLYLLLVLSADVAVGDNNILQTINILPRMIIVTFIVKLFIQTIIVTITIPLDVYIQIRRTN